jgi:sugar/nucleoside kinase (ribokinase family)
LGAAGANVEFLTLLGNDNLKEFAISRLRDVGVNIKPMVDEARPTTNKNVIIAEGYRYS